MKLKQFSKIVLTALVVVSTMGNHSPLEVCAQYLDTSQSTQSVIDDTIYEQELDIKYFQADSSGNPIQSTMKTVDLQNRSAALEDGVYLVDKGYGWVRSEEDFIQSAYGSDTDVVRIMTAHTSSSTHKTSISVGVGIKTSVIESMLTTTYGHQWTSSNTVNVGYQIKAEEGKNLFAKIYVTSRRWDTITVVNGQIQSVNESYAPSGTWAKTTNYTPGTNINQSTLVETQARRVTDSQSSLRSGQELVLTYDDVDYKVNMQEDCGYIEEVSSIEEVNGQYILDEVYDNTDRTAFDLASLNNGYYTVDYGDHWVRPSDAGVLHTFVIPQNSTGIYEESVTSSTTHSTDFTLSNKVTIPGAMVTLALNTSYGYSWTNGTTQSVNVQVPAKEGFDAFAKIQTVCRRIDVVYVEAGEVIARESSYIPTGFMSEKIYYAENTTAEQGELYSNTGYNVLGATDPSVEEVKQYTLSYNLNGGYAPEGVDLSPQSVLPYASPVAPSGAPVKYGHVFMGWYVNTDCTILMDFSSWVMQKDGTVFAKWHENPQFTLSFNLNGGTGDIESQLVYRGETPIEPSVVPTKDGYAFDGWYIDGNLTKPMVFEEWEMAYSGTVFAKWVEVTEYTVSFDANGGTGTYRDIKVIEGNKIVEPAAPTRVGYSFIGWETWSGNRVDISSYRVYSNLKLFAVWSEASYTLEFNLNGGSGVFPTQYYIYGQNPVEPSTIPTKTGYTFEGWYIDSKLTKPMVFEEWEMQHSGAVFAKWSQASFKVSFANTGSDYADLGIEDQFVTADGLITKPADPVREGFKFVGWFAYAGATQQVDFNTFKVSGDQMIYARWVNE